jgi:hypothetical protein
VPWGKQISLLSTTHMYVNKTPKNMLVHSLVGMHTDMELHANPLICPFTIVKPEDARKPNHREAAVSMHWKPSLLQGYTDLSIQV